MIDASDGILALHCNVCEQPVRKLISGVIFCDSPGCEFPPSMQDTYIGFVPLPPIPANEQPNREGTYRCRWCNEPVADPDESESIHAEIAGSPFAGSRIPQPHVGAGSVPGGWFCGNCNKPLELKEIYLG